jgi:hypothetical protein
MCHLHPDINTVISTWENESWTHPTVREYLSQVERSNLTVLVNDPPKEEKLEKVHNVQNRYLQFLSSFIGVSNINTEFTIKFRSDEYYSNIYPIIDAVLQQPNKLITNDVFFRRSTYLRYHPSDHIMAGKTDKLKQLFDKMLYDCQYNIDSLKFAPFDQHDFYIFVEQQIGMKWIEMHEKIKDVPYKIPSDLSAVNNLMMKHFDVVSCSSLGEFYISANSEKRKYINSTGYSDESKDIQVSLEEL